MSVEEVLNLLNEVLGSEYLNTTQELVFKQSWAGKSYLEIAASTGYNAEYIKYVGCQLWAKLSHALDVKVTKKNVHSVLEKRKVQQAQGPITSSNRSPWQGTIASWDEATDVSTFYGRNSELATLKHWILHNSPQTETASQRCRLIALVGMGGIGKTTLAVKLAEQIQAEFEFVIWRSLRQIPLLKDLLTDILPILSQEPEADLSATPVQQITQFTEFLYQYRCLIVLDNLESILPMSEQTEHYRQGYEDYGHLLRRIADEHHQSCVILTSREKPKGLTAREGQGLPVRSLQLSGLQLQEAQLLLANKGLLELAGDSQVLVERYSGNPLALKIAATTIQGLFDSNVTEFLHGTIVFGDIWNLVDQQFKRLSPLEQQVMYSLATNRNGMTLADLRVDITPVVSHRQVLEALESLQRRSLIEQHSARFTQPSIVMEYMTERLVNHSYEELTSLIKSA
ncbi:NACHT domain-containing protein [Trichocoleus sp. FACHB-591]|uniref:NB-ARC domain-containing protein n=1 Tax=Trichocoleus sp. FACHB-591 TaxID=2692872 RepID=UPI0016836349|nr:NB-ARC domain-containing protein [Trichocoleus sp. FACHB-591]MBD2098363.1 NACHT domain-containing protein [Trichocoleus sp. FACHB-591]